MFNTSYHLPDSPEKKALIKYLEEQINEYNNQEYINEGTDFEERYFGMRSAYRDILDKIR